MTERQSLSLGRPIHCRTMSLTRAIGSSCARLSPRPEPFRQSWRIGTEATSRSRKPILTSGPGNRVLNRGHMSLQMGSESGRFKASMANQPPWLRVLWSQEVHSAFVDCCRAFHVICRGRRVRLGEADHTSHHGAKAFLQHRDGRWTTTRSLCWPVSDARVAALMGATGTMVVHSSEAAGEETERPSIGWSISGAERDTT